MGSTDDLNVREVDGKSLSNRSDEESSYEKKPSGNDIVVTQKVVVTSREANDDGRISALENTWYQSSK